MYVNAATVLRLLEDINDLWNREGFGSSDTESEPLKARLESAIRELKANNVERKQAEESEEQRIAATAKILLKIARS